MTRPFCAPEPHLTRAPSTHALHLLPDGRCLHLLPERAAWLPDAGLLLVADVHFGKAASFRRLGVPVPRGTTGANLARLDALLSRLPGANWCSWATSCTLPAGALQPPCRLCRPGASVTLAWSSPWCAATTMTGRGIHRPPWASR